MGLQSSTLYNFEVAAVTNVGSGRFSYPVSDQTFKDGQFLYFVHVYICVYKYTRITKNYEFKKSSRD